MLECTITETKDIEPVVYEWGAVKWVANQDLDPGCEQSFGVVHILPGKINPEHWHTAAEEIVYMLQGECDVRLGDRHLTIGPGQTLHIPPNTKHEVVELRLGSGRVRLLVLGEHARHAVRRPAGTGRAADLRQERKPALVNPRRAWPRSTTWS